MFSSSLFTLSLVLGLTRNIFFDKNFSKLNNQNNSQQQNNNNDLLAGVFA
ncbi:MAG: hypothetical protein UR26_C0002G0081 [candidate division TM6 bacterium GW2011_GWF2_32_72]|nr:MAG: hypothetical protein UR26_C0002G0081 [candidate division TM6 bacterium GW2011_GWF2_32_72]